MNDDNLYEALEKIFHEPNRLAIMSALCAAEKGLAFAELKHECNLTDGNLNRHLKVLDEANAIDIKKEFVDNKPRTTITISRKGLDRFNEYLAALNEVLVKAQNALPKAKKASAAPMGKTVKA